MECASWSIMIIFKTTENACFNNWAYFLGKLLLSPFTPHSPQKVYSCTTLSTLKWTMILLMGDWTIRIASKKKCRRSAQKNWPKLNKVTRETWNKLKNNFYPTWCWKKSASEKLSNPTHFKNIILHSLQCHLPEEVQNVPPWEWCYRKWCKHQIRHCGPWNRTAHPHSTQHPSCSWFFQ